MRSAIQRVQPMKTKLIDKLFKEKDKKNVFYLVVLLAAGALLIALSVYTSKPKTAESPSELGLVADVKPKADYGAAVEEKLAEILSLVDGAGKVRVMVTFAQGAELVLAEDVKLDESRTTEADGEGGAREMYSQKKTVETDRKSTRLNSSH